MICLLSHVSQAAAFPLSVTNVGLHSVYAFAITVIGTENHESKPQRQNAYLLHKVCLSTIPVCKST